MKDVTFEKCFIDWMAETLPNWQVRSSLKQLMELKADSINTNFPKSPGFILIDDLGVKIKVGVGNDHRQCYDKSPYRQFVLPMSDPEFFSKVKVAADFIELRMTNRALCPCDLNL